MEEDGGGKEQDGGKRKSSVVTLRIEFRIAVAGRFLWSRQMRDISKINNKPDAVLINSAERENNILILFE